MQMYLQSPNALSNKEIDEVYSLAEQHDVGICLYGGTQSPSRGAAEWSASGSVFALRRFMKAVGFRAISKPSYPEVRWTDKNRWE
ncbi:hypothetical protein ACFFOS_19340 [Nocardioides kongjuensis]|uniref:Uncharacterized protein n=1 Tax=Nocardioides kongjuensis TaxID=349522 RepID=A0A852RS02_9ACTN|nr:hypothetical protein [Nocardioides kongjuensis]NYD29382.1 hypothetical protein [Nocardioides kongjuensis]